MKPILILTAAALLALLAACDQSAAPESSAAPAAAAAVTDAGPKVGDKIGESEAEKAAKAAARKAERQASVVAKAMEEARIAADLEARGIRSIGWEDLMPEGEEERLAQMYQSQMESLYSGSAIAEGSAMDTAIQIGTFNTVAALDGQKIRIPGYTVPFEYASKAEITQFLLVPYFGACIHAPPPPPNQTIFVETVNPIKLKDLAQAVWIEGTIHAKTQESDLADAAYTIEMTSIEKYEY
ncbi:DUF3299 domain-containing protein [Hyphomonas johnsonii]|uniref:Putative lipoprotein n=1 Tax=Hyphomonas johnsonii MHS-2 TaxID=1280950 RepID=A0A059FHS0_9PROT|nr:DUF3299 domain-containing protein [Hyphomonas johnsonii]KCZ90066.1 putative lipoprotein [Hyphomonas johnsonii MHS-2]